MSEDESSQGSLAEFIVSSSESDSDTGWLPDSEMETDTSDEEELNLK